MKNHKVGRSKFDQVLHQYLRKKFLVFIQCTAEYVEAVECGTIRRNAVMAMVAIASVGLVLAFRWREAWGATAKLSPVRSIARWLLRRKWPRLMGD